MSFKNMILLLTLGLSLAVAEQESSPEKIVACVTGVTGYFASELVSQLLEKGWTVRGTVRKLSDPRKTSFLKRLNGSEKRLTLMEVPLI